MSTHGEVELSNSSGDGILLLFIFGVMVSAVMLLDVSFGRVLPGMGWGPVLIWGLTAATGLLLNRKTRRVSVDPSRQRFVVRVGMRPWVGVEEIPFDDVRDVSLAWGHPVGGRPQRILRRWQVCVWRADGAGVTIAYARSEREAGEKAAEVLGLMA